MRRSFRVGMVCVVLPLMVISCGRTTPMPPVSTLSPSARALMDLMWGLTPGMSTQDEVIGLLGEAAGTEEPLLGEWTWLYQPPEVPGALLRVTFDTDAAPSFVLGAEVTEMELTFAELEAELGEPVVVYQLEGEQAATYLAYPDQGFVARVDSADPEPMDPVTLLRREAGRSVQDLLEALRGVAEARVLRSP